MLSVIALAVVAGSLLGGRSHYEVRALVQSAGQLVKGNLVKVGGVTVGSVRAIDLTSDNQAQITLRITDPRFQPLHEGTIATIRNTSLSSVAGRQVALHCTNTSNPQTLPVIGSAPPCKTQAPIAFDGRRQSFPQLRRDPP